MPQEPGHAAPPNGFGASPPSRLPRAPSPMRDRATLITGRSRPGSWGMPSL